MHLNFPLVLVIAVAVSGFLALLDRVVLAPRRRKAVASYEAQVDVADPQTIERLEKEPLLVEYGKSFFPVLAVVLVLRSFLVEPFQIPSGSMKPTLEVGDFILVNKFAYGIRLPVIDTKVIPIGDPQRGDVMVFRYPNNPSINYIKRVVGLPGDHIRYAGKQLYVNGQKVEHELVEIVPDDEVPAGHPLQTLANAAIYREQLGEVTHLIRQKQLSQTPKPKEWVVPQGYYFMMGDNRDNSNDSRFWHSAEMPQELWGMVPDNYIVGKAFAVWMHWPEPKLSNLPSFSSVALIH
ncbi:MULTISPECIES: signal peptidase I [Pseudomonas]|uniref:Signal peptidase I n=2 Tax=Pseudomonas abyssi TaxID=170540 RepID=A0A2A3MNI5_9PSED|nr:MULTISPECIES: signal peptidase I [Pseudomonadaceae]MAC98700.1 signal peptidase I [Pseudomonadales bacterium]PBK06274.1 signal peptidase I [Pseudomonas abyssi]RGP54753.1 S26 family signal peptidase [Halopseudomonas gallaeciensis]